MPGESVGVYRVAMGKERSIGAKILQIERCKSTLLSNR